MESTVSLVFDSVGANLHTSTDCFLCGGVAVATYRARGKRCLLQLDGPETVPGPGGLMGTWIWQPAGEGLEVRLELENTGATELVLDALDVLAVRASGAGMLDLGTRPEDWSVYQNGWTSCSPALARHVRDSYYTDPGTPEYRWEHFPHWDGATPGDLTSEWVTVVSPGSAPSLLLGFVTTRDQLAEIRLSFSDTTLAALIARCHLDDVVLRPGERRHSEQLWICYGDDPLLLLEAWSARTGEVMQARVPPSMPTGWPAASRSGQTIRRQRRRCAGPAKVQGRQR